MAADRLRRPLWDLFVESVTRDPEQPAVAEPTGLTSYSRLVDEVLATAAMIAEASRRGSIGVHLPRGRPNVVATLAAASLGRPYVPLPPDFPPGRLEEMCAAAGCTVVVSDAATDVGPWNGAGQVVSSDHPLIARCVANNGVETEGLAYVMFTSGSTGRPKGVKVPPTAVDNLARAGRSYAGLSAASVVAHCANPAFDAATFEIWGPLLNGGTVALVAGPVPSLWGPELAALADGRPTVLFLTTALFNHITRRAARSLSPVTCVLFGGEIAAPDVVSAFRRRFDGRLVHVYGPTETTTFATAWDVPRGWNPEVSETVPVGRAIDGVAIGLRSDGRGEVEAGGEVVIGGAGVAAGYCDDDGSPGPFGPDPSGHLPGRLYRTGDLGRWYRGTPGVLEVLGRRDRQLKVRGFRVEPGEVEMELRRHPSIREAAVFDVGRDANHRLVAGVVLNQNCDAVAELEALPAALAEKLPSYLVPRQFTALDTLPCNSNGKIDVGALRALFDDRE